MGLQNLLPKFTVLSMWAAVEQTCAKITYSVVDGTSNGNSWPSSLWLWIGIGSLAIFLGLIFVVGICKGKNFYTWVAFKISSSKTAKVAAEAPMRTGATLPYLAELQAVLSAKRGREIIC